MRLFLLHSLLALLSGVVQARPLTIDDVGNARLIGKFVDYCECPDAVSAEELASGRMDGLFKPYEGDRLNFTEFKRDHYWIRLSIVNPFPEARLRTLLIAYNTGGYWELYHQQPSSLQKMISGLDHGATGFYPHFSLLLHPGMNQIFLKFSVPKVVLWFGTEEKVANITQQQLHYATTMMSIAILITLASLATAAFLRETLFYYYAFYTFSSFIFMLSSSNILIIYDINLLSLSGLGFSSLINLCMAYELIATLLFISYFLKLQTWSPQLSRVLIAFGVMGLSVLVFQSVARSYNSILQTSMIMAYCILITAVFLYAIRQGFDHAKKALLSWLVYVVGIAMSSLLMLGSNPLVGLNLSWATMNLEMLLFGFISLRELYFRQMKITEDTKHSYEQLQKLVYPDQIHLMKQGKLLEQTMPIKQAEAVILCFDVINSSKIDPNIQHAFFEDFFVHCQLLMSEGIEVDGEKIRLFRVKEMGDGFICSIGFPFPCETNREKVAIMFVERLTDIFQLCVRRYLGGKSCGFGVGIAGGIAGGYFPRSGIMQYDLYGPVVVLATRYENMRRHFQNQMSEGMSIVILQDVVYERLPEVMKQRFQCCDLQNMTFKVRDDQDAKRLWYHFMQDRPADEVRDEDLKLIS